MRACLLVCCLIVLLGQAACSRRVLIDSVPPGAAIRIDGRFVGRTPVITRASAASWTMLGARLEARLPGYRTVRGPLDWTYDSRHWWVLTLLIYPPAQFAHLHPQLHRQPLAYYRIVMQEDLGNAGDDDRPLIYGSDQVPADRQAMLGP